MGIIVDLHNYGQTSNQINEGFERIVDRAKHKLKRAGSAVGIIDVHEKRFEKYRKNTEVEYEDFQHSLYFNKDHILIVRGLRTFTKDDSTSLLAFGIPQNRYLPRRNSLGEMVQEAHEKYNAVIIALQGKSSLDYFAQNTEFLKLVDAVEVFNGSYSIKKGSNEEAQRFFERYSKEFNLGSVVTSGGHSVSEIGSSWMRIYLPDFRSPEVLRESLRNGIKEVREPHQEHRNSSHLVKAMAIRHGLALKLWSKKTKSKDGKETRPVTLIDECEVAE